MTATQLVEYFYNCLTESIKGVGVGQVGRAFGLLDGDKECESRQGERGDDPVLNETPRSQRHPSLLLNFMDKKPRFRWTVGRNHLLE